MQRSHALSVRVERKLSHTGIAFFEGPFGKVRLECRSEQGDFRRIPDGRITVEPDVITDRHGDQQVFPGAIRSWDLLKSSTTIESFDGHLVLSQRSGFIRTDHGYRTERLHCRQFPDQSLLLNHAPRAQGE